MTGVRRMLLLQILEVLTSEYCTEKNRLMMLTLGGSSHLRTLKSSSFCFFFSKDVLYLSYPWEAAGKELLKCNIKFKVLFIHCLGTL